MMQALQVVSHKQEQIKCPWRQYSQVIGSAVESEFFHLLSFKMGAEIPPEIGLLYCSGKKRKKKGVKIPRHSVKMTSFESECGRIKAGNVHKDVFHGEGPRTTRLIGLACWRCEDAAGVKATKASLCRWKWVHYNQRESCDGVFGELNEQGPDSTSVCGTAGSVNVNKPAVNTTRRDAARKRPSVFVGCSGVMWLCALSASQFLMPRGFLLLSRTTKLPFW